MAAYIIFGDLFTFPEGDAATNRVHSYGRGLIENGYNVHVICFLNEYTHYGNEKINGINYYHPYAQSVKSKYFAVRTWKKIIKFFRTFLLVRRISKKEKVRAIIVYTMLPATFISAWLMTLMTGSKLLQEVAEHPLRGFQKTSLLRGIGNVKVKSETRMLDGALCISASMVNLYKNWGMSDKRLLHVPSTVDTTRFRLNDESPLPYPYIGYFGGLTFYRDNIDLLVEAFALIAPKYPSMHLVLGGFCTDDERKQLENLIAQLGLEDRINLLKFLPREEIIKYITNSHILVMVRANDEKTRASFPSKICEYLATSRPVISVRVGEIPDYLTDGENSFIVEPGNKQEMADKIDYVLSDYESALEVGKKGKLLADTVFNYNYQAKRIIPFVESLK